MRHVSLPSDTHVMNYLHENDLFLIQLLVFLPRIWSRLILHTHRVVPDALAFTEQPQEGGGAWWWKKYLFCTQCPPETINFVDSLYTSTVVQSNLQQVISLGVYFVLLQFVDNLTLAQCFFIIKCRRKDIVPITLANAIKRLGHKILDFLLNPRLEEAKKC